MGPPEHKLMQPLYTPAKTFSPKHPSGQNQKQASSNQIQHEGKNMAACSYIQLAGKDLLHVVGVLGIPFSH